jgi:hypothetical protein
VEFLQFLPFFSSSSIDAVGARPIGDAKPGDLSYIGGNAALIDSREKEEQP